MPSTNDLTAALATEGAPPELDLTIDDEEESITPSIPLEQAIAQFQKGLFLEEAQRIEAAINAFEPVQFSVSLTRDEPPTPRVTALCDGKFAIQIDAGAELGQGVSRVAIMCAFPTTEETVDEVMGIWETLLSLYPGPGRKWLVDTMLLVADLRNKAEDLATATETDFVGIAEQTLAIADYKYTLHSDPSGTLWTLVVQYLSP